MFNDQCPKINVQKPMSKNQCPKTNVQRPMCHVQCLKPFYSSQNPLSSASSGPGVGLGGKSGKAGNV